jgi:hypothetical protein
MDRHADHWLLLSATKSAAEPPLRQIIEVLQQVMCPHDAEKLAISVLEIYEDSDRLLPFASPVGEK